MKHKENSEYQTWNGLLDQVREREMYLFNDALNTFYLRLYG